MTSDSLILSWTEPEKDGGSKIFDYVVEIKEISEKEWKRVGSTQGNQTYIQVKKLQKTMKYLFKICARNEVGLSLPFISDDEIAIGKQISELYFTLNKKFPIQLKTRIILFNTIKLYSCF